MDDSKGKTFFKKNSAEQKKKKGIENKCLLIKKLVLTSVKTIK